MECQANSRYTATKKRHVATCRRPIPKKSRKVIGEGCQCDDGYLER